MAIVEKHHHTHVHINDQVLAQMLKQQAEIIKILNSMKQEFLDQLKRIETATTNVAGDLKRLADQIALGGMTKSEEDEIAAKLRE